MEFRLAFYPSKVALDSVSQLSATKLAEIWYSFNLTQGHKSPKMFAKYVNRWPRNLVSDTAFEAKKRQPKLQIRTYCLLKPIIYCDYFSVFLRRSH